jgi:pSer/pThr/pTyr-binding forkhead associated (FHA) protein
MKLIKIGSSQACQLVLNDSHVSSLHAEITILDDGQLYIEDKNSLNGTFVDGKKIEPLKQISIQRGDRISFANTQLVWARIPMPDDLSKYKQVYNIGSNYRNDIILNNQTISSYHASLRVGKDGKVYIHDNGSTNGTKVNGVKIEKNKDVRIKKSDNVICSTEDITPQIQQFFPQDTIKKIAIAILSAAALVALVFGIWKLIDGDSPVKPEKARTAVVYVRTIFHPIVTFDDNPMPDYWDGEVSFGEMTMVSQATAFFLDKEGRMATNRHVAEPWEELDKGQNDKIRQVIEDNMPRSNSLNDINEFLQNSIFAKDVLNYSMAKCNNNQARFVKYVLDVTARIRKSSYKISGKIDHITVGYPGKYYTHTDEFQRCNVLKVSDNKEIDIAILQLNNKKTPEDVKYLFKPECVYAEKIEPLKDQLYTIGYPAGIIWGLDDNSKSLEPTIRETKCSKEPSKYDFEFQANSVAGSSGSPVYNKKGQLVGILYGGYSLAGGATKAIHAKFLKKLYEEEVNP